MKTLVVDNYDSFTFNLVHMLRDLGVEVEVQRNDQVDPQRVNEFDHVIISPGPGIPKDAGLTMEVIAACKGEIPVLGICLGHQSIAEHCGGTISNLKEVHHGIQTPIIRTRESLILDGVPEELEVGRYHSWVVDAGTLPSNVEITAVDMNGEIMALENKTEKLFGLQFHPESIMTEHGQTMIRNFLKLN